MQRKMIAALILASYSYVAFADENKLLGTWIGNDRASQAIYDTIEITKNEISWGGHRPENPYCKTTYTIVSKNTGESYPDNVRSLQGKMFTVFKLKIVPKKCTENHGYFQFALSSENYAEVVPYDKNSISLGWHNFSKLPKESK